MCVCVPGTTSTAHALCLRANGRACTHHHVEHGAAERVLLVVALQPLHHAAQLFAIGALLDAARRQPRILQRGARAGALAGVPGVTVAEREGT